MSTETLNDGPGLELIPSSQSVRSTANAAATGTSRPSLVRRANGKALLVGLVVAGALILSACGDTAPDAAEAPSLTAETSSSTTVADPVPKEDAPAAEEPAAEAEETEVDEPEPPPAAEFDPGVAAALITSFDVTQGSLVFTITVEGDGQALAESPDTQWYQPVFEFDTADGAFAIDGTWAQGRPFRGRAFAGVTQKLIVDAEVTGEWISPSTMVITADNFGSDELPAVVKVILGVRVIDADGEEANYGDFAKWEQ